MADVQILRHPTGPVPVEYTLPDAAELRLKAVYAEFADNGAASSWLPCVTLISDSGDVIGRAVDQGVIVTAGSDADVTWFPGVKPSAAAASTGTHEMVMMVQRTPAQSIPDSTGTKAEFGTSVGTRFYTNAAADWSFDYTGAGDIDTVHILVPGLYLLIGQFAFDNVGNYDKDVELAAFSAETNPIGNAGGVWHGFDSYDYEANISSLFAISPASVGAANNTLYLSAFQASGGAVGVSACALSIVRLGNVFP